MALRRLSAGAGQDAVYRDEVRRRMRLRSTVRLLTDVLCGLCVFVRMQRVLHVIDAAARMCVMCLSARIACDFIYKGYTHPVDGCALAHAHLRVSHALIPRTAPAKGASNVNAQRSALK